MLKLRALYMCEIVVSRSTKKICSTRAFRTSITSFTDKLYAPPVVIRKQDLDVVKRVEKKFERTSSPVLDETMHKLSLSQYLAEVHSGNDKSYIRQLLSVFPLFDKTTYYPKLRLDEEGYLMDPITGPFKSSNNVVIIGGGIVGYSIAHHINRLFRGDIEVTIIENDSKLPPLATPYPMGKIRQQFRRYEVSQLSSYAIEFLDKIKDELSFEDFVPEIDLNYGGILCLASEEEEYAIMSMAYFLQNRGYQVRKLSKAAVKDMYPWMNVHDIGGGTIGLRHEGWFDSDKLLEALKLNFDYYGGTYLEGEVIDTDMDVDIHAIRNTLELSKVNSIQVKLCNGETKSLDCGVLVLAAGTSTAKFSEMFDIGTSEEALSPFSYVLPIESSDCYVTHFTVANGPGVNCPFVEDSSGIMFRRKGLGDTYICEWELGTKAKPIKDQDEMNKYFLDVIKPVLVNRVDAFKNAEFGDTEKYSFEYSSFDHLPVIGFHPGVSNLFLACGFNNDGYHALAAGNYLTELLLDTKPKIDLQLFGIQRMLRPVLLEELS